MFFVCFSYKVFLHLWTLHNWVFFFSSVKSIIVFGKILDLMLRISIIHSFQNESIIHFNLFQTSGYLYIWNQTKNNNRRKQRLVRGKQCARDRGPAGWHQQCRKQQRDGRGTLFYPFRLFYHLCMDKIIYFSQIFDFQNREKFFVKKI
jgi:hypothetical protein